MTGDSPVTGLYTNKIDFKIDLCFMKQAEEKHIFIATKCKFVSSGCMRLINTLYIPLSIVSQHRLHVH